MWSRRQPTPPPDPDTTLETCRVCGADYVNPVDWEPLDDDHGWWMLLRCGQCGTYREVTVDDEVAERFDTELNRRADILARALQKIERQEMAADVEKFIAALRRGLIEAADFAR